MAHPPQGGGGNLRDTTLFFLASCGASHPGSDDARHNRKDDPHSQASPYKPRMIPLPSSTATNTAIHSPETPNGSSSSALPHSRQPSRLAPECTKRVRRKHAASDRQSEPLHESPITSAAAITNGLSNDGLDFLVSASRVGSSASQADCSSLPITLILFSAHQSLSACSVDSASNAYHLSKQACDARSSLNRA
jgi:hypothetical protein